MREADVDLRLKGLDGLLVGEGQRLLDDLSHRAVRVRARRVDPREEGLEEVALAGRDLCKPAPEVELGAEEGVRASVGAHEDEAADELGVPKGQLLRDGASHREAGDVGARTSSARSSAAASSAIVVAERRPSGSGVRPAPRLSKAVRR